jgi:hypothetical protein
MCPPVSLCPPLPTLPSRRFAPVDNVYGTITSNQEQARRHWGRTAKANITDETSRTRGERVAVIDYSS